MISKPLNLRGNPKAYQHIRADAIKKFVDKLDQSMSEALKKAKEVKDTKEDKTP